jgi:hypothetical protein
MLLTERRARAAPAALIVRAGRRVVAGDATLAAGLGLLAFALYLATLARDVLEGDSGEFQYVTYTLGVPHPTGYPLYALGGWLWTHLLPLGTVAWRVNLYSAAAGAAAVGLVYLVARRLTASRAAAIFAAALFASQRSIWAEAVVASVYPLNLALVALALWAAFWLREVRAPVSEGDVRAYPDLEPSHRAVGVPPGAPAAALAARWLALGGAVGLALSHHRTALFVLPGLAVLGLWPIARGGIPRRALAGAAALALGLPVLLHLYVPWRAGQMSEYGYVLYNLGAWLSGSDFAGHLGETDWPAQVARLGGTLYAELGPGGLALAALGLATLAVRRGVVALGLALIGLTYLFFALAYRHGDLYAPITNLRVYILPVFLVAALLAGEGAAALGRGLERVWARWRRGGPHVAQGAPDGFPSPNPGRGGALVRRVLGNRRGGSKNRAGARLPLSQDWERENRRVPPGRRVGPRAFLTAIVPLAGLVALAVPTLVRNYGAADMSGNRTVATYARARLTADLAPNAALIGQWDDITPFWYLQRVEGVRRDVEIADAPVLSDAWTARAEELAAAGRPVYIQGPLTRFAGPFRVSRAGDEVIYRPRSDRDFDQARTAPLYRVSRDPTLPLAGGSALALLGAQIFDGGAQPLAAETELTGARRFTVDLRWQTGAPVEADYAFSLRLVDASGEVWAQADKPPDEFYYAKFRTSRWPVGAPVWDRYALELAPGTPPGEYTLTVTPYLPGTDRTLAPLRVGTLRVGGVSTAEAELPGLTRVGAGFGGATLLGYEPLPSRTYTPGELLRLVLYFATGAAPEEGTLTWGDRAVAVAVPGANGPARVVVSVPAPAGGDGPVSLHLRHGAAIIDLGAAAVRAPARQTGLPTEAERLGVRFGEVAELAGFTLDRGGWPEGGTVGVTLYWRALAADPRPLKVFVHLSGGSERIWAQDDRIPGERPSAGWLPGEIIADRHLLRPENGAPAGEYRLLVGLYDGATGQRLAAPGDASRVPIGPPLVVR